ncbi:O-antigen polymerase [Paraburkholderia sp. RL17-381-BIF-C]|uniref:O-antigen polymerase n=1 Tax=Paraburkholderia sp. RL17-381-BIF-C TaxID=3031635 RepID=UPI0038B77126
MATIGTYTAPRRPLPLSLLLALSALFAALGAQIFPVFGIICLATIACSLLEATKKNLAGPAFVMLIVFSLYVLPRAALVLLGAIDKFSGFDLSDDNQWIIGTVLFVYAFLSGTKLSGTDGVALGAPAKGSKLAVVISLFMIACSILFFFSYLKAVGGVQGLIANYNAETYFAATQDEVGSASKNGSIYTLISGFAIVSAALFALRKSRKMVISYSILCGISLVMAVCFIKREYAFDVLMAIIVTLVARKSVVRLRKLALIGFAAAGMLFLLFLVRSGFQPGDAVAVPLALLDTSEFWVLDQIINVYQNGIGLTDYDYGWLHVMALVSPFMPFDSYVPLDHILVERSMGISGWGIPPTIFGYAFLVFGWIGLIPYGIALGYLIGRVDRWLKNRTRKSWSFLSAYMIFIMYCWFLFRNGDPVLAVFYTNRYLFLVIFVALIEWVFNRGSRRMATANSMRVRI